ncbi:helix-turn-helix domain-containing protein, partial [Photobacterium sp. OFAV2-7]|uniref:winged helix-turn-helix transcriptional regulator n=1 Tax=Photobacterium sp. OFAV2-7 TaxID=2917748 RepID=UPI001EF5DEEF
MARAISVFGDRWTLLILREIFLKVRRFSELQRTLGISKHRLSDRLNRLVDDGVLYKEMYDETHKRFEYKLTEKGLDLYPIIIMITRWGDKWLVDEDGVTLEHMHKGCEQPANPKVCCSQCGEEMNARNSYAVPGPGILNKIERNE